MKYILNFLLIFFFCIGFTQQRKTIQLKRFDSPPKIDGIINDQQWENLTPASNFKRWMPNNGSSEKIGYESFVYVGYDDNSVYVAGIFNNPNPIPIEFSQRDDVWEVNAETFFISINTYDDNINYQSFQITSAGTLGDRYTSGEMKEDDQNFDTVFESKAFINDNGWSMEMRIPYSALRFPSKEIQKWGINFGRKIVEFSEVYTWNFIDNQNSKYPESMGITNEIKNITPPLRLFFYPYAQSSVDFKKGNSPVSNYSAGMDIKYGINNSFTLDATLIPDFGQVTFDDKELNLTPFEQQFDENRAFFTEGASLFSKADGLSSRAGNFFYSRRIGEEISFDENDYLLNDEEILNYDGKPDLLNSIKITGTTDSGLSIGFINSITNNAYARIRNTSTGELRKQKIAPITNYNILSLTQKFLNEFSSVSLTNTNVYRSSKDFENANNSAFVLDLFDNKKKFNIKSMIYQSDSPKFSDVKGFRGFINIEELTGNFRYAISWNGVDANYTQNDLGFYRNINDQRFSARTRFTTFKPTKIYNKITGYFFVSERSRFFPKVIKSRGGRAGIDFTTLKLNKFAIDLDYTSAYKNYDEPRKKDTYIIDPAEFEFQFEFDSDNRKKIQYSLDLAHKYSVNENFNENKRDFDFGLGIKIRANNKLNFDYRLQNSIQNDDVGQIFKENNIVYFGVRNVKALENNMALNYNFDSYRSINVKLRQFWSSADYSSLFYALESNGSRKLSNKTIEDYDPNTNFNLWNFDLGFNWEFAPGSKATLLYRNNIFNEDNMSGINYYTSSKNLFEMPMNHQISLRVNYFLDFNLLKKKQS